MRLFFLSSMLLFTVCAYAQKTADYSPSNKKVFAIEFEEPHQSLGKVRKGETRKAKFVFTNTGTEDIKIELVSACECTTLDWPRKPVKPGEKAVIDAVFDSSKKEESETIEIDINFKNVDPATGYKRFEIVSYSYELIP